MEPTSKMFDVRCTTFGLATTAPVFGGDARACHLIDHFIYRPHTIASITSCTECFADQAEHLTSRLSRQSLMPKEYVNPNSLSPSLPHGFSQAVITTWRKMVFISGQTAWDARKNIGSGDSVLEQARQAFRNLEKAMEAAGGTLKDIVALRIYVVDFQPKSGTAVGTALREFFSGNPPASTWIGVSALAAPEFLIKIEATAVLD
jgi:enamine deaminase RidA (YjgF/YER057c/UK114 family)